MKQSSTARTLDAESTRAPRTRIVQEPRRRRGSPATRRQERQALATELARLEKDIAELREDFQARIGPLTKAYGKAFVKLRKLKHVEREQQSRRRS